MGLDYATYPANFAHQRRVSTEGARWASPAEFTLTLPNVTTAFVAIVFGLRGPTSTVADGGVAGGTALGIALDWIRLGVAERLLVGVSEPAAPGEPPWWSTPIERSPARRENAACWLLESPASAAARGATVLARLTGYAASSGADCVDAAWADAGRSGGGPTLGATHFAALTAGLAAIDTPQAAEWHGAPPQRRAVVLEPAT
jgi:3-oxoacyl-(acyl-carrier-protein) synthase